MTPTGKEILKGINVGMYLGAKIGLLGPNGAGKSTLLKILADVEKSFDGDRYLDPKMRVGYLAQVRLRVLVEEILLWLPFTWRALHFLCFDCFSGTGAD